MSSSVPAGHFAPRLAKACTMLGLSGVGAALLLCSPSPAEVAAGGVGSGVSLPSYPQHSG